MKSCFLDQLAESLFEAVQYTRLGDADWVGLSPGLAVPSTGDRPSRPATTHPLPETYLTQTMKATGGWARKSAQYSRPNSRRPSGETSAACQRTWRRPAARNAFSIVPALR